MFYLNTSKPFMNWKMFQDDKFRELPITVWPPLHYSVLFQNAKPSAKHIYIFLFFLFTYNWIKKLQKQTRQWTYQPVLNLFLHLTMHHHFLKSILFSKYHCPPFPGLATHPSLALLPTHHNMSPSNVLWLAAEWEHPLHSCQMTTI